MGRPAVTSPDIRSEKSLHDRPVQNRAKLRDVLVVLARRPDEPVLRCVGREKELRVDVVRVGAHFGVPLPRDQKQVTRTPVMTRPKSMRPRRQSTDPPSSLELLLRARQEDVAAIR